MPSMKRLQGYVEGVLAERRATLEYLKVFAKEYEKGEREGDLLRHLAFEIACQEHLKGGRD